jgi:MFS family permease
MSFWQQLLTRECDWKISLLGWTYTLFLFSLAAPRPLGSWLEKVGPRLVSLVATLCWCGGLLLSALAIYSHQLWLLWLGAGVIGGIGLGLGYISPVSTLLRWFPDKRGMAAGMAIMGFGGGALVGAPLANWLMNFLPARKETASGRVSWRWRGSTRCLCCAVRLATVCRRWAGIPRGRKRKR